MAAASERDGDAQDKAEVVPIPIVADLVDVDFDTLPGGLTARLLYRGNYAGIGAAYDAAEAWLVEHGYVPSGLPWESYLDGPERGQPRTVLQVPCATGLAGPGNEAV